MVIQATKRGIRFVWVYVVGGLATANGFTFPLFLIARELRMGTSDAPRLRAMDVVLLGIVAVLIASHVIWVQVG